MWDVNKRSWTESQARRARLIWTMWDVNAYILVSKDVASVRLIWTMWDVNQTIPPFLPSSNEVWSELCGMWTFYGTLRGDFDPCVWSELCGMWTDPLRMSLFENDDGLIWTMWDVNWVYVVMIAMMMISLIWTMWDVNIIPLPLKDIVLNRLIWTMWDVNLSCGVSPVCASFRLIWTMWDVNRLQHHARLRIHARLIWTMWDVNWYMRWIEFFELYKFDLNYVGCEHARLHNQVRLYFIVWSELCGMWTASPVQTSTVSSVFDLNYVGCEHCWEGSRFGLSQWFDLNYVGCEHIHSEPPFKKIRVWSELCGMWTHQSVSRRNIYGPPFDLNYVGCEQVRVTGIIFAFATTFDLNYVGCEHRRPKRRVHLHNSLIWTMWDVNLSCFRTDIYIHQDGIFSALVTTHWNGTSAVLNTISNLTSRPARQNVTQYLER